MSETTERQSGTLVGRTLSNLAVAWREIAQSAARSIGLNAAAVAAGKPAALKALMAECLEARGGEVSARMRAAELGKIYLDLDDDGRRRFLETLAGAFATDEAALDAAIEDYRAAGTPEARAAARRRLRQVSVPPRVKLITQFNDLPEGVKFLVDMRADLLSMKNHSPALDDLDADLRELLASWFDTGFLDLHRVTWQSPAALLEKLIAYEAVHAIQSWEDLRHRVESENRRLFALFHPRMPQEPLAFVEVALVKGLAGNVQTLLDPAAPEGGVEAVDTAIFYSITNTQKGLRGISFGDFLIKRVVHRLSREIPRIKTYATLSPLPGFRVWLAAHCAAEIAAAMTEAEQGGIRALGGSDDPAAALEAVLTRPDWHRDPVIVKAVREPLLRLCARYLTARRDGGGLVDSVARFHLRNGARLERINWLGDTSPKGLSRAAGLMVNYRYDLDHIEANHEAYVKDGRIAMSSEVRALARPLRG